MIQFIRTEEGRRMGKLLSGKIPEGAEVVGHVVRSTFDEGAIVRLRNLQEVQMNAGVIRSLPRMGRPQIETKREILTVRVSPETLEKLNSISREQGVNIGRLIDEIMKGV